MNLFAWLRALLLRPSNHGPTSNSPNSSPQSSTNKPDDIKPSASRQRHYQETIRQTPNVSPRKIKPELIVVHHTDGSYSGSVAWCLNPTSKVSYHCIIARDGRRTVLAQPTQRAWHAGKSSWRGRNDCNSFSVGVAFEGNTYVKALGQDAIDSFLEYVLPIMRKHGIPSGHVTDHRTIAPKRKVDIEPHQLASLKWQIEKAFKR